MGFIKGPVCRGQVALNVITDYFWIGFINPDSAVQENQDFLAKALKEVRLPTEESSAKLLKWRTYSEQQTQYLRAKSEALNKAMVGRNLPNPSMLWNGDGNNPNAALTVFRHFDNATVVQGFVGDQPQTAMLMGYPLLERMHYLLVAGFDVFGNTAHQLEARLYMDFLRMEGELNVLAFLPKDSRNNVRDLWYRDAPDDVKAYMNGSKAFFYQDSGIDYKTDDPWAEFTSLWKAHMRPVLNHRYDLANSALPKNDLAYLEQLAGLKGRVLNYLPEAAVLSVRDAKGTEHHFTLIRNSAHSNISELFKEDARRLPEEDTMSVVPGFLTAYPNAFYRIDALTLPKFVQSIANMKSALDYTEFSSRYAIRRTDERFWPHSDALIEGYRKTFPLEAGLFDYNRFENR
jgi:hypothetical protein